MKKDDSEKWWVSKESGDRFIIEEDDKTTLRRTFSRSWRKDQQFIRWRVVEVVETVSIGEVVHNYESCKYNSPTYFRETKRGDQGYCTTVEKKTTPGRLVKKSQRKIWTDFKTQRGRTVFLLFSPLELTHGWHTVYDGKSPKLMQLNRVEMSLGYSITNGVKISFYQLELP